MEKEDMETFPISIEISGSDRERFETVDALVDTGVTYSYMPAPLLRSLGVSPFKRQSFRLADGSRIHRDLGQMSVRINGRVRFTPVVFSENDDSDPILGAVTLEEFSVAVDPAGKRLVPTDAIGIRA